MSARALTLANVFAILKSSARYPSGPRERSAKPPFVGSNPTRASNFLFSNQWITTFVSFPPSPTWEHLGTTGKRASCPNSCPIPQQLPLRAMWIASHSSPSDSLSELQFTAGLARQIQFREDVRIEEAPRSGCSCKGVCLISPLPKAGENHFELLVSLPQHSGRSGNADRSQPPPSAWTSVTASTMRRPRIFTAVTSSERAAL